MSKKCKQYNAPFKQVQSRPLVYYVPRERCQEDLGMMYLIDHPVQLWATAISYIPLARPVRQGNEYRYALVRTTVFLARCLPITTRIPPMSFLGGWFKNSSFRFS